MRAERRARTSLLAALTAALLGGLLTVAAPAGAAATTNAAIASTTTTSPTAVTVLPSSLDACLRGAARNPGGVLILVDGRMSASNTALLAATLRGLGRPTCIRQDRTLTVGRAAVWWTGLPQNRRTDTVVLALGGTVSQVTPWLSQMPFRRLLGTPGSGMTARNTVSGWTRRTGGAAAGRAILTRLGELMINAHPWAAGSIGALTTSPRSQCAAALASPKGVLVLGDSITAHDVPGLDRSLKARGYLPCIYAQSSSRITEHLRRIVAGAVPLPRNVIVALGNNDIFTNGGYPFHFRSQAWSLLARLAGHNIVWPTVWRTRVQPFLPLLQHNAAVVDNVVRDLAKDEPTMLVPDWASVVRRRPGLQFDGIHLTPTGLAMRYDMLADSLDRLTATTP